MTAFAARGCGPSPLPRPSRPGRARRVAPELTSDAIEQIAQRVAELLEERRGFSGEGLVDAGELARQLGVTRAWVYQHASELGGVRIGSGPRARLRFDVRGAKEALGSGRFPSRPVETPRHRVHSSTAGRSAALLPITPRRVCGLSARLGYARRH